MLWIERYRPENFSEILGQENVISHLKSFAISGNVPHLLLAGPNGTGKSSALCCLIKELYGEREKENLSIIDAGTLFNQGKNYLEKSDQYSHIYKKEESLLSNFKNIVRFFAGQKPLDHDFRVLAIEDAGMMSREAQQGLRRIMERYSATCRFIFCTTKPSAIIPAITSRCLLLHFGALENDVILDKLHQILEKESMEESCDRDDLDLIAHASCGDMRKAIMLLQLMAEKGIHPDQDIVDSSDTVTLAALAFSSMKECSFEDAKRYLESLMIEYGLSGREVVSELVKTAKREYADPKITCILAETDFMLGESGNDFIQISNMAARIISEVFLVKDTAPL